MCIYIYMPLTGAKKKLLLMRTTAHHHWLCWCASSPLIVVDTVVEPVSKHLLSGLPCRPLL